VIKLLINQDRQIVDYGNNIHEDADYFYGDTYYGQLSKNMFMPWSGIVEIEALPENSTPESYWVNQWEWDAATQSIVKKEFPVEPAAVAAAVAKTVTDFDAIVREVVGQRLNIYLESEAAARDYAAAGYTGQVPTLVAAYAMCNPTGTTQTNQWAADWIIARADFLRSKEQALHVQRLASQSQMRAAIYKSQFDPAVATWNAFVAQTRADLGLPVTMYSSMRAEIDPV
jgi:hypothetical protein